MSGIKIKRPLTIDCFRIISSRKVLNYFFTYEYFAVLILQQTIFRLANLKIADQF